MRKIVSFLVATLVLNGCSTLKNTEKAEQATPISLKQAMKDLMEGLDVLVEESKKTEKSDIKLGIVPSKIKAVFDISTTTKNEQGGSLTVIPIAGLTAGGTFKGDINTDRGNSITIEFENIYLLEKEQAKPTKNIKHKPGTKPSGPTVIKGRN